MENQKLFTNRLSLITGFVALGIVLAVFLGDETVIETLSAEDGLIENISAGLWFIGFVVCIVRLLGKHSNRYRLFLLFWALFCFFCLGEETSWFQRFIHYSSPSCIENINAQDEFNLHNIDFFQGGNWVTGDSGSSAKINLKLFLGAQNLFRFGYLIYFLFIPILLYMGRLRTIEKKLNYPCPNVCFVLSTWSVLIISFVFVFFNREIKSSLAETREMLYALFILLYIYTHLKGRN